MKCIELYSEMIPFVREHEVDGEDIHFSILDRSGVVILFVVGRSQ